VRLLDNMSLKRKKAVFGFLLLTPYLIGFVLFFVLPVIKSLVFSFNNITSEVGRGVIYRPVGLNHYIRLFTTEVAFRERLVSNVVDLYVNVPMIVIYSLFIAVVLNKRFRGRNFAKVIFFLPVIITSGVMLSMESSDYLLQSVQKTISEGNELLETYNAAFFDIKTVFLRMQISEEILKYLMAIIQRFYDIVISSGVPITLLLAALQSISPSVYESAAIEGATAWEAFWKITLPLVSPYVFMCAIYAIIDSFTNPSNKVIEYIMTTAYGPTLSYGYASAMTWIYFIVIAIFLSIIGGLFARSRVIFYYDM
jgi:ABC-type sugar transport system permease subunit